MSAAENQRTVLVTGARGYLGGRICRAIAEHPNLRLVGASRQLQVPKEWPDSPFIRLNVEMSNAALRDVLRGVDAIIHLAGADRTSSEHDVRGAFETTTVATAALVEGAIASQVSRFIYISTAHVYGAPLVGRIDERIVPRPAHPYAITHRAAEDFVLAAHSAGKIFGTVLRLSNGIGAPAWSDIERWDTIGNDLCRQAVTKRAIQLTSSGEQWRDFITLGDVASAVLHILNLSSDELEDGLFNLGGALPLRILDIADFIADRTESLFGQRPPIFRAAGSPAAKIDYRIDKISATGFRPRGDLKGEIDATLQFCARHFVGG